MCKYCTKMEENLSKECFGENIYDEKYKKRFSCIALIENEFYFFTYFNLDEEPVSAKFKIEYCPKCGEKLEKEKVTITKTDLNKLFFETAVKCKYLEITQEEKILKVKTSFGEVLVDSEFLSKERCKMDGYDFLEEIEEGSLYEKYYNGHTYYALIRN